MSSEYVNSVMVDAAATAYRPAPQRGVGLFGIVLGTGYVGVPPFVERSCLGFADEFPKNGDMLRHVSHSCTTRHGVAVVD